MIESGMEEGMNDGFDRLDELLADARSPAGGLTMDYKLELVVVPVADVDRAKAFYSEKVGFTSSRPQPSDDFRIVQLTPPGSGCSIMVGKGAIRDGAGLRSRASSSCVERHRAAHAELTARGLDIGADPSLRER